MKLLDFVVVVRDGCTSFADPGLLAEEDDVAHRIVRHRGRRPLILSQRVIDSGRLFQSYVGHDTVTRTSHGDAVTRDKMREPAIVHEPWVAVEEVARHLGVAKDTVYRWIEQKGLPAQRVGRLWKFKLSDVDMWVRAGSADDERSGANR